MLMSVFNHEHRVFDHYEVPETKRQLGVAFGQTRRPKGFSSALGSAPESLAIRLPANAVKVGSSDLPRGVIATTASSLAGIGDGLLPSNPLALAILAIVSWEIAKWYMKRGK